MYEMFFFSFLNLLFNNAAMNWYSVRKKNYILCTYMFFKKKYILLNFNFFILYGIKWNCFVNDAYNEMNYSTKIAMMKSIVHLHHLFHSSIVVFFSLIKLNIII